MGASRSAGLELASQLLRSGGVRQAGFNAELVARLPQKNVSVLFKDGDEHRRQRSAVARFFAPAVVVERYRRVMTDMSVRFVDQLQQRRRAALDDMSLDLSVAVAAEIVGSPTAYARTWQAPEPLFTMERPREGRLFRWAAYVARAQLHLLPCLFVRRAARHTQPQTIAARRPDIASDRTRMVGLRHPDRMRDLWHGRHVYDARVHRHRRLAPPRARRFTETIPFDR